MSPADVAPRLAANLRRLRDARGLTQAQAARLAGLPRPTWTTLELRAEGQAFALEPGDVVVFHGDQRHAYRNAGSELAVGYSVVVLAPPH